MDDWSALLDSFWLVMAWICTLGLMYGSALVFEHLLPGATSDEGAPEPGQPDATMAANDIPRDSLAMSPRLDR